MIIACYFCVYVLIYGASLFKNGYHQDEIADFSNNMILQYIAQQRWGLSIFRLFAGASSVPWAAGVCFGFCLSLALFLQTEIIGIYKTWQKILYGLIYLAVPQTSTVLIFSLQSDAMGFSILLITGIVYTLTKSPKANWYIMAAAIIVLTFATACYQTTLVYYTTLCTVWLLSCLLRRDEFNNTIWPQYFKMLFIIIPAIIIYFLICHTLISTLDIPEDYISFIKKYRQISVPFLEVLKTSIETQLIYIMHCIKISLLSMFDISRMQFMYMSCIIPALILTIKVTRLQNKLIGILICSGIPIFIMFAPFVQTILFNYAHLSHVGMITTPLSCASLWALLCLHANQPNIDRIKPLTFGLVIIFCFNTMYLTNKQNIMNELQYDAWNSRMNILLSDAYKKAAESNINPEDNRILLFYKKPILFDYLKYHPQWKMFYAADTEEFQQYEKELESMTTWPAPNSIITVDNKILIKM